jgi:hypothetical protein
MGLEKMGSASRIAAIERLEKRRGMGAGDEGVKGEEYLEEVSLVAVEFGMVVVQTLCENEIWKREICLV